MKSSSDRVKKTANSLEKVTTGHTIRLINILEEIEDKKLKSLITELVEGALLDSLIRRANTDKQLAVFEEKEENLFLFGEPISGIGWYPPEYQSEGKYYFRWMGESDRALFSTICKLRTEATIRVNYTNKKNDVFEGLSVYINGKICHGVQVIANKTTLVMDYKFISSKYFNYISVCFECKVRFKSSNPADTRKLGVAVSKIEIL